MSAKVHPAKSGSHSPTLVEAMNLNGSTTQLNGTALKPERNGHLPPINGHANGVVSIESFYSLTTGFLNVSMSPKSVSLACRSGDWQS